MTDGKWSLETRCIHQGEGNDRFGSLHTPIYNATTFGFESISAILDIAEGRTAGPLYSRYGMVRLSVGLESAEDIWRIYIQRSKRSRVRPLVQKSK